MKAAIRMVSLAMVATVAGVFVGSPAVARADDDGICSGYAKECDRTTDRTWAYVDVGSTTYTCHSSKDAE